MTRNSSAIKVDEVLQHGAARDSEATKAMKNGTIKTSGLGKLGIAMDEITISRQSV